MNFQTLTKKLKNSTKENKYLIIILILGFLIRVVGFTHGYPYIFNFDEPTIVRTTQSIFFNQPIDHYDWPHFNYYFSFIFYFIFVKARGVLQIIGMRPFLEPLIPILWDDPFSFYALSRFLNGLFGALTVIPVFLTARDIFKSKKTGLWAAFCIAFAPFLVLHAHLALQDTMLLFWGSWAVYSAYLTVAHRSVKQAILFGVFLALASGVKYNAVLMGAIFLAFAGAELYIQKEKKDWTLIKHTSFNFLKLVLLSVLVFMIVFFVTNPRILTDWETFWSYDFGKGFLWQLKVNSSPTQWSEYPLALVQQGTQMIIDTGIIPLITFLIGIYLVGAKKINRHDRAYISLIMLTVVIFFMYTSFYERAISHYYIFLYGLISLVAGYIIRYLEKKVRIIRYIVIICFVLVNVYMLVPIMRPNTQWSALDYVEHTYTDGQKVYYIGESLSETRMMNNLDLAKYKEGQEEQEVQEKGVIISEKELKNDTMLLVKTIDNSFRRGPVLYVYEYTNSSN